MDMAKFQDRIRLLKDVYGKGPEAKIRLEAIDRGDRLA